MTKKDDPTPNAASSEEQQSGGVAVAEKPKEVTFADDDPVTVLHGWGRLRPGEKHYVDRVLFEDGIARNVPYRVAKHWKMMTRPDGKAEQVYGKVTVHVLPNTADESDFCRATGITPMPSEKFAAMLTGVDLDEVVKHLGIEKVKALIRGLEQKIPGGSHGTTQ